MSASATEKKWEDPDLVARGSRGLSTELAETLFYLSGENRVGRQGRKPRENMVRESIGEKRQSPSILASIVAKLVKSI